jgi:hypothetical protein
MAEETTYTLLFPITPANEGGEVITEIVLRKPNLKRLKQFDIHEKHGQYERTVRTLAAWTKYPPAVIEKIEFDDLQALNEAMEDFTGVSGE